VLGCVLSIGANNISAKRCCINIDANIGANIGANIDANNIGTDREPC
jgi:hypothetical protein